MSIVSRIQTVIGTEDSLYVNELIQQGKDFIKQFCSLDSFPENTQGYLISNTSASTDISDLYSSSFWISANGYGGEEVNLTLTDLTSGSLIASAIQTAIRNLNNHTYDEITCTFDSSNNQYTITSGRFGESSNIHVYFQEDSKHVCEALKLSKEFGAKEFVGGNEDDELTTALVQLVTIWYRRRGIEDTYQGSTQGISWTRHQKLTPELNSILLSKRRLRFFKNV